MTKKRFITNDDIKNYCGALVHQMTAAHYRPGVIVAPVRGGLGIGVMLSHYFQVPMLALPLSTRDYPNSEAYKRAEAVVAQSLITANQVLVVDDINDTGRTLEAIDAMYNKRELAHWVKYAVLLEKPSSKFSATFVAEEITADREQEWVVFPYEDWWQR
jgi:hypoxanthine phosphoribosyltransferase